MKRYTNTAILRQDSLSTGNADEAAPVMVYIAGTTTEAAIFSDVGGTTAITQPFLTNTAAQTNPGQFSFYSAGGLFDIVINEGLGGEVRVDSVSISTEVSVKDFGAVGDGVADDTSSLILAVASMGSNNATLVFDSNATYLVNTATAKTLFFNAKTNFTVKGNNATIKVKDSEAIATEGVILWFQDCTDGYIENLILDGNRANRTPAINSSHNVYFRNGNKRLMLNNVRSNNSVMDGYYLATSTPADSNTINTDITFNNCHADNAFRNGMSPIETIRLRVLGGTYSNTVGTSPEAGIDLEDNGTAGNLDPIIDGAHFEGNTGAGLVFTGVFGCTNAIGRNLSFKNNTRAAIELSLCHGVTLKNIDVGEHTAANRGIIDLAATATTDVSISNITYNDANAGSSKWCMYIHSSVVGPISIDGMDIFTTDTGGLFIDPNDISINNVTIKNSTGTQSSTIAGKRCVINNWYQDTISGGLLVTETELNVNGFYSKDCLGSYHVATLAADVVFNNGVVIQNIAKPVGQKAYNFVAPPNMIANCYADSVYTSSDAFDFTGGLNDTSVLSALTPSFFTEETVSSDNGDAAATLTRGLSEHTQVWSTPITADRAVTLSTTNARSGDRFRVVRTASATGAFNLNVGTGPLKAMGTAGSFCDVEYNGASWILTAYSLL